MSGVIQILSRGDFQITHFSRYRVDGFPHFFQHRSIIVTSQFSSRDFVMLPRDPQNENPGVSGLQKVHFDRVVHNLNHLFPMSSPTFQSSPAWFLFSPDSPNCIMNGDYRNRRTIFPADIKDSVN